VLYARKLDAISKEHYPETDLLRQVEGIGPLTALTFVLTLKDPRRFERMEFPGSTDTFTLRDAHLFYSILLEVSGTPVA
jgi:hypothetical protein